MVELGTKLRTTLPIAGSQLLTAEEEEGASHASRMAAT